MPLEKSKTSIETHLHDVPGQYISSDVLSDTANLTLNAKTETGEQVKAIAAVQVFGNTSQMPVEFTKQKYMENWYHYGHKCAARIVAISDVAYLQIFDLEANDKQFVMISQLLIMDKRKRGLDIRKVKSSFMLIWGDEYKLCLSFDSKHDANMFLNTAYKYIQRMSSETCDKKCVDCFVEDIILGKIWNTVDGKLLLDSPASRQTDGLHRFKPQKWDKNHKKNKKAELGETKLHSKQSITEHSFLVSENSKENWSSEEDTSEDEPDSHELSSFSSSGSEGFFAKLQKRWEKLQQKESVQESPVSTHEPLSKPSPKPSEPQEVLLNLSKKNYRHQKSPHEQSSKPSPKPSKSRKAFTATSKKNYPHPISTHEKLSKTSPKPNKRHQALSTTSKENYPHSKSKHEKLSKPSQKPSKSHVAFSNLSKKNFPQQKPTNKQLSKTSPKPNKRHRAFSTTSKENYPHSKSKHEQLSKPSPKPNKTNKESSKPSKKNYPHPKSTNKQLSKPSPKPSKTHEAFSTTSKKNYPHPKSTRERLSKTSPKPNKINKEFSNPSKKNYPHPKPTHDLKQPNLLLQGSPHKADVSSQNKKHKKGSEEYPSTDSSSEGFFDKLRRKLKISEEKETETELIHSTKHEEKSRPSALPSPKHPKEK